MMKIMFFMLMMVPLSFKSKSFWFNQWCYFFLFFLFFLLFGFNYNFINLSYFFGYDLLSFVMIILSMWICSLMIMGSTKIYKINNYYNLFLLVVLILMISLVLTFASLNLFIFYLFFEISLIPTLLLIIGWGYQPERLQAGVYLLFYTMFASLPMLLGIFYIYYNLYTLDYAFFNCNFNSILLYFCINMVFFVKMPVFFIHMWLPKAHVEAPVSGSMILAGVMLKLGGYGLLRMMILFMEVGMKLNIIIIVISLVGGFYVSLICLRQVDIKALIAYSSVAHMGITVSGIMTMNYWGMAGSLVMMLAHGLCSSGLFCLANISYERLGSRSMFLNKGLMNLLPTFSLWWFLFSACNMAAPPSLNLLGEIMLINSLVSWSPYTMLLLSLMSFFSAGYSLYLYAYTQHGKMYSGLYSFTGGFISEFLLLLLHWIPLNILILKSEYFSLWL
uniref:NADH-ubiquinone oxidoreductase chain 4 n=1 Tax=Hydrophilidae sp. BMNH 1274343 TaxID=1796518 RepID=A0A126TFJ9_9COLE|nr:NADH dehydrogenase subunit 4 [Hydrophilidae sp. BMNH 1274343]